jgi:hypothetical protein
VGQEEEHGRVELEQGAGQESAIRDVALDPALGDPEGHQSHDRQARGDRQALEVLGFAVGVLGHVAGGDVEAGETREAGEHEAGEEELVEGSAHAGGEGGDRGSDAERDLVGCVSWEFLLLLIVYCVIRLTRSASESSSAPIKLLFPLHLATMPSKKSNKRPNGISARAVHKWPVWCAGPRQ